MEGHLYGDRVWFSDTRSPVRRMGISTHAVDSTIVISLVAGRRLYRYVPVARQGRWTCHIDVGLRDG